MSQEKKQWGAIIVMIALFAMIAFVTNLAAPIGVIWSNKFEGSNFLGMMGNMMGNMMGSMQQQQPQQPAAAAQPVAEDPMSKLQKLKQMLDMGLISQQDFDSKKKEILSTL